MERFQSPTIGSFFVVSLLAGAILLGGCSDSLTGATPPDAEEVTVQEQAQHNTSDVDTNPQAGHNTSDED